MSTPISLGVFDRLPWKPYPTPGGMVMPTMPPPVVSPRSKPLPRPKALHPSASVDLLLHPPQDNSPSPPQALPPPPPKTPRRARVVDPSTSTEKKAKKKRLTREQSKVLYDIFSVEKYPNQRQLEEIRLSLDFQVTHQYLYTRFATMRYEENLKKEKIARLRDELELGAPAPAPLAGSSAHNSVQGAVESVSSRL